jgi:CBS domain-containing protein
MMAKTLRDVMSPTPVTVPTTATVADAAARMRDAEIGDVLVLDGNQVHGIVTDRDIVVRAVAGGLDPASTSVRDVCTSGIATLAPDDDVKRATEMMAERAVRRIPVVENGVPVGIVSIGDLAIESNGEKALADISAAKPNN